MPPPRRLRADAARNQQRIIAAARELFAERGLDVTLDDVAEAARVGVGTVYRRFANKRELIEEVFDQHVAQMAEATERANHHPDPWVGLTDLFEWACQHMAGNRGFSEVMLELPDAMERFASVRSRIKPALEQLMNRAHAAGVLREGITGTDFFAMVNMVESMAAFSRPINPDTWRRYMAIVLDGVRADDMPRLPLTVPPLTDDEVDRAKALCTRKR
ncbi:TetR/AcrR family transcriptional regulator [Nocardia sp. CDC159]|uniref:TetR/AcrR family transcriptional regulator n=1 Tax=Nocardia pulmonis TaxID=2951408 RepID=A0A9X2IZR5_9NOCA|nr:MULTISPECIES: TetR/AcrR family transcriptional regulator [Nocardia]MCM6776350.1 TetR/AcrR family transcriptional regulator [Nocardia pulmonis]MCM6788774.1 TetR/AcrR family transcriptional regulator [Nocardia sp. CDC159]